jgi:O-antigen/teichoic acid export membrane protein
MSQIASDLKRVASSSGLYAVATLLQRGLSFILLPVYTRFLVPADYGVLELLNALSAVLFGLLLLGLPSALTKVLHRDCETDEERKAALPTALALDAVPLLLGGSLLFLFSEKIGLLLIGEAGQGQAVRLTVGAVLLASLVDIVLAGFRAREKALSFVYLNLLQFGIGMLLNVVLVVAFRMGILGVLWGNLIAAGLALPFGLFLARHDLLPRFEKRLARPLLTFGILVVPTAITGWVITMADRYVLRFYGALEDVAVYSVGYKIGMVLQMGVVWPFQLAWPAVAFAISKRAGHQETYARVLTYLSAALAMGVLGLSLVSRVGLTSFAGPSYSRAHEVVPWVALAYAFAGVQFCLAPGVHLSGLTHKLPRYSLIGALLNLGLNFLWVPYYGMMGSTWATTVAYFYLAASTAWLSHKSYPVKWEYGRILRIAIAGGIIYTVGTLWTPREQVLSLLWQIFLAGFAYPALLLATGFLTDGERRRIVFWLERAGQMISGWWRTEDEEAPKP